MNYIKGYSELVLIVNDIRKAADFYRDVVGLQVETSSEDWVWFIVGDKADKQRLAIHKGKLLFEEYSPLPPGKRFGQIHYAFNVERENLETAIKKIKESGIEIYGPKKFDWMNAVSYYFYDPDGNLIEYWSPNI